MIPARLLALDVSSTATGFAFFEAGRLRSWGVIRPADGPNFARIDETVDHVLALAAEFHASLIVLEWSSGKIARRIAGRKPSGLSVLGAAQGAVRQALREAGYRVECVDEAWTGGVSKTKRAARLAIEFPALGVWMTEHDRGFDAVDAVGIGLHAIARHRIVRLMATGKGKSPR